MLCFFACYQPKKGCIDITASNYDVAADEGCCCTYPVMKAEIQSKWIRDTVNKEFAYNIQFPTTAFKINKIRFYLSNIRFVKKDGSFAGVSNKIPLTTLNNKVIKPENNFLLVRPEQITYTIGDFKSQGDVTKLQMTVGVPDSINQVDAFKITDATHPLASKPEVLWSNQTGYTYIYIEVKKGTSDASTTYKIAAPMSSILIDIPFSKTQTITSGFDILFKITINYAKWFEGVDFQKDSDATVATKIAKNIPTSISVL